MRIINYSIITILIALTISCAKKVQNVAISDPGFGITTTIIEARSEGVDIPVFMKTQDVIKGFQFTLKWNPSVGQVLAPQLTDANSGFTVSAGEGTDGAMKVLVFSMSGDILQVPDTEILTIPVRIIDSDATTFSITLADAIFAGPKATSYNIPVTHGRMTIEQ